MITFPLWLRHLPQIPKARNLGENWKVRLSMERKDVSKIYIPDATVPPPFSHLENGGG
jgi:hypothetical protein